MSRDLLVVEVCEHRARWADLRLANDERLRTRERAGETASLPPVENNPVVRARPEHLDAVAQVKKTDDLFLAVLTAILHDESR